MRIKSLSFVVTLAITVAGCCSTKDVADSKSITVDDALKQVGQGLRDMHDAAHPGTDKSSFGLFVDEVDVTFNVTTTADNKLVLSADAQPPAITGLKVGGSYTNGTQATRGNTITVKLQNPLFAPTGTLAHDIFVPEITKQPDTSTTGQKNTSQQNQKTKNKTTGDKNIPSTQDDTSENQKSPTTPVSTNPANSTKNQPSDKQKDALKSSINDIIKHGNPVLSVVPKDQ